MAESLPIHRYQLPVISTEGADLGGGNANTWISREAGAAQERAWIRYDFTTSSGYVARQDDWSREGQAIRFGYDPALGPYAKKRQFILGSYAWLREKSFSFSGELYSGSAKCYLGSLNGPGRKRFARSLNETVLAATDHWFSDLAERAYHPVSRLYLYPQPGITDAGFLQDVTYTAAAELTFDGAAGEHPPYLDMAAEDVVPSVTGAQPVGTFADRTEDITLRWTFTYEESRDAVFEGIDSPYSISGHVYGSLCQRSARVRWTEDGVTIHEISVGPENFCALPGGSVRGEGFRWQVEVCSDDGVWSSADQWYEVPCDNDTISTAAALSPQKRTIDGGRDNLFRWEHFCDSGSRPTGADLQWSADKLTWSDLLHVESRDCSATVPAGSLPAGAIFWRVRTYNASAVAGLWSEAVPLTVRNAPPAPTDLYADSSPYPEISWSSLGQLVAEVQVDGLSQRLYGTGTSLRWKTLLEEGPHTVAVRVQNSYGLWSDWAELSIQTLNYPQSDLVLFAAVEGEAVRLTWNRSFPKVLLYRGGSLLAELGEGELSYLDGSALGAESYLLRGISAEGYYSDSNEVVVRLLLSGAVLAKAGEPERKIPLKGRYKALPLHSCTLERQLIFRSFAGKSLPLALPKEQWYKEHRFLYSLTKDQRQELELLRSLSGEAVLYRDSRGVRIAGILSQVLSADHGLYLDIDFRITEAERSVT